MREERDRKEREMRRREAIERKRMEKRLIEEKKKEKEARSYDRLFDPSKMRSNKFVEESTGEDDFM